MPRKPRVTLMKMLSMYEEKIESLKSEKADLLEALNQLAYLTWESTGTYPEQWEQAYGDYQAAIAKVRPLQTIE